MNVGAKTESAMPRENWLLQHKEERLIVRHVEVQKRDIGHAHRLEQRLEEQQQGRLHAATSAKSL